MPSFPVRKRLGVEEAPAVFHGQCFKRDDVMRASETAPRRALVAMALVSSSVLAMQIALTRILSVVADYHGAFLVVSIVMLGLSASAVDVYVGRLRSRGNIDPAIAARAATLGALGAAGGLIAILESGRVPALSTAGLGLGSVLFLAAFHEAGWVVAWLLDRFSADVSRVYLVDLVAAAGGCIAAVGLLNALPTPSVVL